MTEPSIDQFVTSDGYQHHFRHWLPADRPLGYVVALHGIQSHSGWYVYSCGRLCDAGYEVLFVDRRGSGLNEAQRGHARHEDRLINDVLQFLGEVRERRNEIAPTVPVVMLGLSWGGKLASIAAARRPELIDGLALLYPGIYSRFEATWWDNARLSAARATEQMERRIPIPLDDPQLFTSQPAWQQFIRDDRLALSDVTVSFLLANRQLDRIAREAASEIRCPSLLMLAGRDQIIDNAAVTNWFDSLTTEERALVEYPGASHTLEFEADRELFVNDLLRWLVTVRQAT